MSPEEHLQVKDTLTAARNGGASLGQVMRAHQIAEKNQLHHTVSELRQHVRTMIPDVRFHFSNKRAVVLGIITGIFVHYTLKAIDKNLIPTHPRS